MTLAPNELLAKSQVIAVVGMSTNPTRRRTQFRCN